MSRFAGQTLSSGWSDRLADVRRHRSPRPDLRPRLLLVLAISTTVLYTGVTLRRGRRPPPHRQRHGNGCRPGRKRVSARGRHSRLRQRSTHRRRGTHGRVHGHRHQLPAAHRLGGVLEVRRIPESGHVIVCGLSTVGFRVVEELVRLGERVVVIDRDPTCRFVPTARRLGAAVMIGDAAVLEVLRQANAASAERSYQRRTTT